MSGSNHEAYGFRQQEVQFLRSATLDIGGTVVRGAEVEGSDLIEPDSVSIAEDGRFEVDLTSALMAAFAEGRPDDASYSITASHEVYFDETGGVSFSANDHARVLAGEEVALDLDLELKPAAVLRGTARLVDEMPAHAGGVFGKVLTLGPGGSTEIPSGEYRASVVTLSADLFVTGRVGNDGQLVLTFVEERPGIELALLRAESGAPLATTRANQDGSFEFRVAEDGPFLVVAVVGGRPPASRPVELALKSVLELEEELELAKGPRLEGLVEDFGAFPGGGIALEARRLPLRRDVPIEWPGHDLAWSRGEVVRTAAATQTEDGGLFTIEGLSPGAHEVRLAATGSATLFSEEELDAAAEQATVPASDLQLVLPLAVLEVHAVRPPFMEEDVDLRFVVEDPATGARLADAGLDGEGRGEVVARPGQVLRIRVVGEGLAFQPWEGAAPEAGERIEVRVPGSEVPRARDGEDG